MYKILIRPLTIDDSLISYRWRNDSDIWKYTGNRPDQLISAEIEKKWINEKLCEKDSRRYAILVDDQYVGNIQITNIIENETGEYHIFIGEKFFWGRGIAKQATAQIIRVAKEELCLKEVYLKVNPENLPALRVYEKCGFIKVNDEVRMKLYLKNSPPPLVSVFMMTYNHEQYIRQALESILMQKTNFDFEVVVGEDSSTDSTRKILLEIYNKYPGRFKLLLHESNIGAVSNQTAIFNACSGKYITICEGDDYWTDNNKLQKQVDFLEDNIGYGLIYSRAKLFSQKDGKFLKNPSGDKFKSLNELLIFNYIPTPTVMFRAGLYTDYLLDVNPYERNWLMGDYPLWLYLTSVSKVKFLDDCLSVYRILDNSATHSLDFKKELLFVESYHAIKIFFMNRLGYNHLAKRINGYYFSGKAFIYLSKNRQDVTELINEINECKNTSIKIKLIKVCLSNDLLRKALKLYWSK